MSKRKATGLVSLITATLALSAVVAHDAPLYRARTDVQKALDKNEVAQAQYDQVNIPFYQKTLIKKGNKLRLKKQSLEDEMLVLKYII